MIATKVHRPNIIPLSPAPSTESWCAVGPVVFNETINCERHVQVILGQFFPELLEEDRIFAGFIQYFWG
jgi:hypothetical protein